MRVYDAPIAADMPGSVIASLRRVALVVAAGFSLAGCWSMHAPTLPSDSALGTTHLVAVAWDDEVTVPLVGSSSLTWGQRDPVWQGALHESSIAIDLLAHLLDATSRSDVSTYIETVSAVLDALPDELTVESAAILSKGLRYARLQLEGATDSYQVWSAVVRAVAPAGGSYPIPRRLIREEVARRELPLEWLGEEWSVGAARSFWGDDADPVLCEG